MLRRITAEDIEAACLFSDFVAHASQSSGLNQKATGELLAKIASHLRDELDRVDEYRPEDGAAIARQVKSMIESLRTLAASMGAVP